MTTLTDGQIREITQLWFIGDHYFKLSRNMRNRFKKDMLASKVGAATSSFKLKPAFVGDRRRVMLLTAHLGSCAVRLATVDEILGAVKLAERFQLYNTLRRKDDLTCTELEQVKNEVIHFILRNNIGHHEPGGTGKKQAYNTMEVFLGDLSIEQVFESMKSVIGNMRKDFERYCKPGHRKG